MLDGRCCTKNVLICIWWTEFLFPPPTTVDARGSTSRDTLIASIHRDDTLRKPKCKAPCRANHIACAGPAPTSAIAYDGYAARAHATHTHTHTHTHSTHTAHTHTPPAHDRARSAASHSVHDRSLPIRTVPHRLHARGPAGVGSLALLPRRSVHPLRSSGGGSRAPPSAPIPPRRRG